MPGSPALNQNTFSTESRLVEGEKMTIQGAVNKASILLALVTAAAAYTWYLAFSGHLQTAMPLIWGGAAGGFVLGLVTIFKKDWSAVTAPIYAICEGFFLGGISAVLEMQYRGIVLQAVMLTFGTLAALLGAYKMRLIVATDNFKRGVVAATGGIALVYLVTMVLRLFFHANLPFFYGSGPLSIGISLVIVVIAALNLVIDFDVIEQGAERGAPKYFEWYAAFGLLVTLVWLYLEILRLLSKLNRRN